MRKVEVFKNRRIKRMKKAGIVLAAVVLAAFFSTGCAQKIGEGMTGGAAAQTVFAAEKTETPAAEADKISVTSTGEVTSVPDKAEISLGVRTEAKTPEEAQEQNAEAINSVIEALKKRGVEEKSISTNYYSLYPEYDYSKDPAKLTGYRVETTMKITDQDIDEAGGIITDALAAGANQVDNIRFFCSNYDEAYKESLDDAVKGAEERAKILADAAGRKLGRILSITEGAADTSARYSETNASADAAAGMSMKEMKVMPGETKINANVTVVFELK